MINMKLRTMDLKLLSTLFKTMDDKEKAISLEVLDKRLIASSKTETKILKVKRIKVEEENKETVTIKKDFLTKLEKINTEEIELKLNKKSLSSKVKGLSFQTAILDKDKNYLIEEKNEKGVIISITSEIIENLNHAKDYVDKKSNRQAFQGVNLKLENKILSLAATNSFRMFVNQIETEAEGEFNIVLRPDAIETLVAISDAFGKQPIPTTINEKGLFVNTPVLYFGTVLIAETFPDINKIIDRAVNLPIKFKYTFKEEEIEKLKLISIKADHLSIERKGEFVDLKLANQIEKNSFTIVPDEEGKDFTSLLNYQEVITSLQRIPEIIINERMAVFISGKQKIILNVYRQEEEE